MQKDDTAEELLEIQKWKTVKSIGDKDKLTKKYESMGLNLRLLSIAFFMASNQSMLQLIIDLPMLAFFKNKLEIVANSFISNPGDSVLASVWNVPGVYYG